MTTQLLTGIPGTGKTHHLTERALRYLADGNDPARLLILAPTRTAATRMRDVIAASSDRSLSVAPTRAWAAYAFDLLKRAQTRGLLSGVEGNLKLLSGPEQDVIIGELLANHAEGIAPGPAWPDVLRDALATRGFRHEIRDFFDRMAEYDLTAEDVHRLATEHNQPAWHALAQLHTEYRAVRALRAKNAYDPAVLINDACRLLLRAPEFLAEERRRYDLILIDDVQELSPSIYRLLRLIAAEIAPADAAHLTETHPDLFAEGPQVVMTYSDEAVVQGFRGARPDLVTTLQASFPSIRTRTLTTSYRLPALMMPLVADIRRRLPRYTRFVPLTPEQEGGKNSAQEGSKNGAPATFGRINTTPADEALTWGAADEPLLHLGADGKILDPAHYRDRYPHELSGGEQQRIGILRAIAAKPQVLLMDEPFSALDPLVRTVLQDQIAMIHQKFGTTIVFVTHDMQEAAKLACRIGVMHNGKLVQIGTPEEIKKQPANDYVQSLFSTADAPDAERIIHQFLRLDKQGQEAVRRAVL